MTLRCRGMLCAIAAIALLNAACGLSQRAFPSTLSDDHMLSVMHTVNRSAVDEGSLAKIKAVTPSVQAFAQTMEARAYGHARSQPATGARNGTLSIPACIERLDMRAARGRDARAT